MRCMAIYSWQFPELFLGVGNLRSIFNLFAPETLSSFHFGECACTGCLYVLFHDDTFTSAWEIWTCCVDNFRRLSSRNHYPNPPNVLRSPFEVLLPCIPSVVWVGGGTVTCQKVNDQPMKWSTVSSILEILIGILMCKPNDKGIVSTARLLLSAAKPQRQQQQ